MSNGYLSATPVNPYEWRESVLSTRSLSELSTGDGVGSPGLPPPHPHSRVTSTHLRAPMRQNTMSDESDYGLEMAATERGLGNNHELPESVAQSLLFVLPREIRDKIYCYCLMAQGGLPVEWPTMKKAYAMQPQLLRTCKIIFDEAAPLLYSLNHLTFHHPSDANMFARAMSSPELGSLVSYLSLHIKAQDTRLWMPYLTSKYPSRSLKADFPTLRELSVRFRSNKWQHSLSPEQNMKLWCEDPRLDEIVDGLRHVFLPQGPHHPKSREEFEIYISNHPDEYPLDPGDPQYKRQWLEIQKARVAFAARQEATPAIKVVCACRVHTTHFNLLTNTSPSTRAGQPAHGELLPLGGVPTLGPRPGADSVPEPDAVKEGEPFRGFTAKDLRANTKRLHDPDLGSADVARTPYADKAGILVSLEIHCLDPRRDNSNEQRSV